MYSQLTLYIICDIYIYTVYTNQIPCAGHLGLAIDEYGPQYEVKMSGATPVAGGCA